MTAREIECGAYRFNVRADRREGFWNLFTSRRWEPATIDVLERHLGTGRQFVDIGAWIGPLTLLALAMGSDVLAFEPDPVARRELEDNVALNPQFAERVTIDARAVESRDGTAYIVGGGDGLGDSTSKLGSSTSKLGSQHASAESATVDVVDVAELATTDAFRRCALLKCDIEGSEYAVVPRLRHYLRDVRPALLLSLHGYDLLDRPRHAPKRVHLAWLRARQAVRRGRLMRALGPYPVVYCAPRDAGAHWRVPAWSERVSLAVKLSEAELYATDEPLSRR
jgi:FkbM family methyltransferase